MANTRPKAVISWSSGKDAAAALADVGARGELDVVGLVTTFREHDRRINIHNVHESLVDAQAKALGLALDKVYLPTPCSDVEYEEKLGKALLARKAAGVTHVVFGDLLLEDIRRYREGWLAKLGLTPVFPLFGQDTTKLASRLIRDGYRAVLAAVDTRQIPGALAGRQYDGKLLADLPPGADPCGENGEFHTFVYDGPGFRQGIPLDVSFGIRDGDFQYAELTKLTNNREYGPSQA